MVNNSWTFGSPGCNLEFQLDLRSLRAVGIVPVFAASNFGPGNSTSASPANYPEAFAVGAANNSDLIYAYSSHGPSACGEAQTVYPELVAPGVNINTTDLFGMYYSISGTSLSAPHVAGALALLLSAHPEPDRRPASSGVGQHGCGPWDGRGLTTISVTAGLDLQAAFQWLQAGGSATPTPTAIPPTAHADRDRRSAHAHADCDDCPGPACWRPRPQHNHRREQLDGQGCH